MSEANFVISSMMRTLSESDPIVVTGKLVIKTGKFKLEL
jgi:hypothetical protein